MVFWRKLEEMLNYYRVTIIRPSPLHLAEAGRIRSEYGLTYFDSLHCAVAVIEGKVLISYDRRAYERVSNLTYSHPAEVLSKVT